MTSSINRVADEASEFELLASKSVACSLQHIQVSLGFKDTPNSDEVESDCEYTRGNVGRQAKRVVHVLDTLTTIEVAMIESTKISSLWTSSLGINASITRL